jgi:hypothetical protein
MTLNSAAPYEFRANFPFKIGGRDDFNGPGRLFSHIYDYIPFRAA